MNPTPEERVRRRKEDGKEIRVPKAKETIQTYVVNFQPELKVIIWEAKYLDWIGLDIPQTIINIALQEKEYFTHVDWLNQLLREYNAAIGNLKKEERSLLKKQINELNQVMDKGVNNHNWFSLSINAFIRECWS